MFALINSGFGSSINEYLLMFMRMGRVYQDSVYETAGPQFMLLLNMTTQPVIVMMMRMMRMITFSTYHRVNNHSHRHVLTRNSV